MIPLAKAKEINAQRRSPRRRCMREPRAIDGRIRPSTVKVHGGAAHPGRPGPDQEDGLLRLLAERRARRGRSAAFLILDIVLGLIGSIALAVSSLGIMNTMVMSILERTREIGIMKAIGGSDGDIRRIFLIEASAIGFFGGVAGVVLGWLVGRIINFGANIYIVQQGGTAGNLFSLPFWLIGGAHRVLDLRQPAAGQLPGRARRAARSDPGATTRLKPRSGDEREPERPGQRIEVASVRRRDPLQAEDLCQSSDAVSTKPSSRSLNAQ